MAVAASLLGSGQGNTTGTVTPAAGSVVLLFAQAGIQNPITLSGVSGLGLTWTKLRETKVNNAAGSLWAGVGAASSGQVSITWSTSPQVSGWQLIEVTGTSGVAQSAMTTKSWGSAPMSTTLPSTVAASSLTLGAYCTNSNAESVTAGTGWTVLKTLEVSSPYATTLTETKVGSQTADIATAGSIALLIAVELAEASTPPATGTASGSLSLTGTAHGIAPVVPVSTGTATSTLSLSGTAHGQAPTIPPATGTATGTLALAGTAHGQAPVVAVNTGTATGTLSLTGTAHGQAPAIPVATGTASGTLTLAGTAHGIAPDPARDIAILSSSVPTVTWDANGPSTTWATTSARRDEWPTTGPETAWTTTTPER